MSSEDPRAVDPGSPLSAGASPAAPSADAAGVPQAASPPMGPSVIGPTKAASQTRPVDATPQKPWGLIACVLFGLIIVGFVVLTFSFSMRDGVVVGIATFLSAFAVALAVVSLIRRKRAPSAIGGVAIAALSAGLAAAVAAGVALYIRDGAMGDVAIFDEMQAGLGAYQLGQAQSAARGIAWFGLLALPGFSLGALGLIFAYGDRKEAKRIKTDGVKVAAPSLALLVLVGASVLFLGGIGATIAAIVSPVNVVDHPMVPRIREVHAQLEHGDLANGCTGLEALLPEKAPAMVVPRAILAAEVPDYREFAHRCVTLRIDALPRGLPCTAAAGALLGSPLVEAARAQARVKQANERCLGP